MTSNPCHYLALMMKGAESDRIYCLKWYKTKLYYSHTQDVLNHGIQMERVTFTMTLYRVY